MKFYRRFKKKENSSSTIQQTVAETVAEVMKTDDPGHDYGDTVCTADAAARA